MTRRTSLILLLFCLLGLAAAGGSAWVHYRLLRDPGYSSFCDISTTWSCATVYESRYGAFRGVPVAVGGLAWFAVAALLIAIGSRLSPRPQPAKGKKSAPDVPPVMSYLFAWSVAGLSVVLYLAYASLFVLHAYCILCLTTYVAVIGIFVTSGSASETDMRSLPARVVRDLRTLISTPAALVATLAVAAGLAALVALFPRQVETPLSAAPAAAPAPLAAAQQSEFERWYTTQPRVPIAVANDGAKVVVLKFNDYMCPPCRQTFLEYKPVLAKWQSAYPGLVKFEVRDYPLDPECNANAPGGQHLAACEAAAAVRLAKEKGRASEMEVWLYDNQTTMTPALVRQGVKDVGRVADFESRYAATVELVKGDIALGAQLKVTGTPTFFVNGVKIPGLKAEFFDAAIAYELKQAGVIK